MLLGSADSCHCWENITQDSTYICIFPAHFFSQIVCPTSTGNNARKHAKSHRHIYKTANFLPVFLSGVWLAYERSLAGVEESRKNGKSLGTGGEKTFLRSRSPEWSSCGICSVSTMAFPERSGQTMSSHVPIHAHNRMQQQQKNVSTK